MLRSGRISTFIREYKESPKTDKLSFIPPFLILIVEAVLLMHALTIDATDIMVVELTTVLLIISIIEIILVSKEIHDHYQESNYDRVLTIRLDDFINQHKNKNVKIIVEGFINKYPSYKGQRGKIYRTSCQILETHQEDKIEEEIDKKLKDFIKKQKKKNVDDILKAFIRRNPKYKKNSDTIYVKICDILSEK